MDLAGEEILKTLKPAPSLLSKILIHPNAHSDPHRGEAAAHVSIGHREARLVNGLLKHQVNDTFEPLLCVDGQVRHLLHQLVELLRRQLVQDAANFPEELLRGIGPRWSQLKQSLNLETVLDVWLQPSYYYLCCHKDHYPI